MHSNKPASWHVRLRARRLRRTFRRLKLPLVANARHAADRADRRSLIMVTSAVAGEGKTFCATNLALSIAAEVDSSVLLVDADAEHAGLMRQFGIEPRPGLYDLLTQPELRLRDVVLKTNVPRLELLPPERRMRFPENCSPVMPCSACWSESRPAIRKAS